MKQYLFGTMAALLFFALVVGLFNFRVDPYAIHRYGSATSASISRLDQVFNMRLSKPWQVLQAKPAAVVIGSSRAGSMPSEQVRWNGQTSYNFSMPALTLYEMLRAIQHANSTGDLKYLSIGLEFETFITGEPRVGLGFAEGRYRGAEPAGSLWSRWVQYMRDLRDTLLTGHAITRSMQAVFRSNTPQTEFMPNGSWHNHSQIWLGEPGYIMVGKNLVGRQERIEQSLVGNMAIFRQILEYCYSEGIETRLYLSPEHLFLTQLRRDIGLADEWMDFHRQLVDLNGKVALKMESDPYPLWGFNQMAGIVDERLPKGSGSPDSWFRDGIHFHGRLGELIMSQIWETGADVGVLLNNHTVQSYVDQVDVLRQDFVQSQPKKIRRYRKKILGRAEPLSS